MKRLIVKILKRQTSALLLLKKRRPKVIVISGSIGKTSTTQAIAAMLSVRGAVRKTIGNYNTDVGVPCSVFGNKLPRSLKNPFSWAAIIIKNQIQLYRPYPYDFLVLELGTDTVGEIAEFAYLHPDVAFVTAIAPEHMEYFKTLDVVAEEELGVLAYAKQVYCNRSMVPSHYVLDGLKKYELNSAAVRFYDRSDVADYASSVSVIGEHSKHAIAAAIAAAKYFGFDDAKIKEGLSAIQPQSGRMNPLPGKQGSYLIDDTYNASPEAVIAALDYLYSLPQNNRIALLGNMNELGETSEQYHRQIGVHCDPNKLALVVTLGKDASVFTAEEAEKKGCKVIKAASPYEAAEHIAPLLSQDTAVLLKGSQNGVFAEEATKLLLENPDDAVKLVRQSPAWLAKKQAQFGR